MNRGLCSPSDFRDNCGFGLIAHAQGQASHRLLDTAIESLACMTHRGGIAADGKTGDGCGLLFAMPDSFMREEAPKAFSIELGERYAVGQIFLSQDPTLRKLEKDSLEAAIKDQKVDFIGWREVPVDSSICGETALESLPVIEQIFVQPIEDEKMSDAEFRTALYLARKQAKAELIGEKNESETDHFSFYVCSFSPDVISYKGLIMPKDIRSFYLDLADARLETKICVFHQRFSTNTLPKWPLAQPFRYLAHNGEINTVMGNRNWALARTAKIDSPLLPNIKEFSPLVNRTGSDSSSLDNMLELMICGGMDMFRAVRMLVPPAWQNMDNIDPDLRSFYEYSAMKMEPWDGPAGIVITNGRYAACLLDRNGLRPARYVITKDGFITLASEVGVNDYEPEDVISKGRIGPGQIFAVDTETGEVLHTDDIDGKLKSQKPYKEWLQKYSIRIHSDMHGEDILQDIPLIEADTYKKMFLLSKEELSSVIIPMARDSKEAVGAMGDDTPMAVLSTKQRSLYEYFRQQFAQVTNPPIDSLRESIVMSLETCMGSEQNLFDESEMVARRAILTSPILSPSKYRQLLELKENHPEFSSVTLDLNYNPSEENLEQAVRRITDEAEQHVRDGKCLIILSDRKITKDKLPMHALLATGAIHHRLIAQGLRCDANIIVETATARDAHHMATLIGFGAAAIYPYLTYLSINSLAAENELELEVTDMYRNYRKAINKGLLKIMSKMGISAIASYRGAQLFEAIGLSKEIIDLCFVGVTSRIAGAEFSDLENDQAIVAKKAWIARKQVSQGGLLKYVHGEEYHAFNPDVIRTIRDAVATGDYATYKKYADLVNLRPVATLRDLLKLKEVTPVPLEEVEPVEAIVKRFDSAGMSLGALSPEAHEALATAMNRLGARSNSGEGGEDPVRYGTEKMSKIKQVASGRFGVTPAYLVNAEVLQIKVAQGAKPGEGGQLPGTKVNKLIARLRYSVPGVTLISPPPHHDIYSIEDLAQLIFDLKQVNPSAKVSVKLVSEPGVGTIAAGVAKAYADLITISGYDGGTAASPLTSIRYAGSPWELGLSEAQQALRGNGLRDKVLIQTDGGLKTGLDVVKAAMMGAESFGFGTTPMVALGCIYLRICHLNNCATGVATQHQKLREENFHGTVEMVMNFFRFVAMETREWMAKLGVRTLDELVGRTDLLEMTQGATEKHQKLDLTPLLKNDLVNPDAPQRCLVERNEPFDQGLLAETIVSDVSTALENRSGGIFNYTVTNCDRSVGARLSGEIAKRYGNEGMNDAPITLHLKGTAGQSFGVWNAGGLHMYLEGDANDYVGKGMAGGRLVISPPKNSEFKSQEASIIGNTCLYGATGGKLLAAGRAGERFAVRNSGAVTVVEGAGDHCCEYMTGGVVVVLGDTGYNFGAGMTGGFAYALDLTNDFPEKLNLELVEIARVTREEFGSFRQYLGDLIKEFVAETKSEWGSHILENFDEYVGKFWLVKPKASEAQALLDNLRQRGE